MQPLRRGASRRSGARGWGSLPRRVGPISAPALWTSRARPVRLAPRDVSRALVLHCRAMLATLLAAVAPRRGASPHPPRRLLPHRQLPPRSASASTASCSSRCRSPARRTAPSTTPTSASTSSRSASSRRKRVLYSRGLRLDLRRVGDAPTRRAGRTAPSPSRCASPRPPRPVQVVVKKRDAEQRVPGGLVARGRPAGPLRGHARPPSPGPVLELLQDAGDPATKLDLLLLGDGYTEKERAKFEKDARRLVGILFEHEPFRSRRRRLQRVGALPARRRSAASRGRSPASTAARASARPTTRSAPSATSSRFENRSLRDVAVVRAVRRARDPGERARPTAAAASSTSTPPSPPTAAGRATSSSTSSATRSRRSPTSTSPPRPPTSRRGAARAVGAERHRRPAARRSGRTSLAPGAPLPTPWPKEAFTKRCEGVPGAAQGRSARENRPEAEMDALFLAQQKEETALLSARAARRARWARSRARTTRRAATTGRRWTASCSPAIRCRSARCAGGRCRG